MSTLRTLLAIVLLLSTVPLAQQPSPIQDNLHKRSLRHAIKNAREVHIYVYKTGPKGAWKKQWAATLSNRSPSEMFRHLKECEGFGWAVARTTGVKPIPDFSFVFLVENEPPLEAAYILGSQIRYYGNAGAGGPFQHCDVPVPFKKWVRTLKPKA